MSVLDESDEIYLKNFDSLELASEAIIAKEFEACTFTNCDFSEATFNKCKFVDCKFIKCNLSVIRLVYSKFWDVEFEECKVMGVDWTQADWSNIALRSPLKFYKSSLNDCSFFGLNLEEIVVEACSVHNTDFREANLIEANFTHSDFSGSLFHHTNLTRADFCDATDYDINIYDNNITKAKFIRYEAVRLLESLDVELVD